jgi:sigma-B regulation protein RsbU (phosphoserine phosphatase)
MKSRLSAKMALVVLIFSSLILGAVVADSFFSSRSLIVRQAEELSRCRGRETAESLALVLKPVEQSVRNLALAQEDSTLSGEKISELSQLIVQNNQDIFGMAVAFAPYGFSGDRLFFAPYSYRSNGKVQTRYLGGPDYRYFDMDWFRQPREQNQVVWTEPYFDRGGGNVYMTTCSAPFYRMHDGKRIFAGVVTADIALDWLEKLMSSIRIYKTGYALLLSRDGTFIYHPDSRLRFHETVFSLAEKLDDGKLREIGRSMIAGETGFIEWTNPRNGKKSFLYYMPLSVGGWSLALFFPAHEVLVKVGSLARNMLLVGATGLVLLIVAVILVLQHLTKPVRELSAAALSIADGNLATDLPVVRSRDEIGTLAIAFQIMQDSLREYVADLETTTRQKERIESELRIARDIQMALLPKTFPDHDRFSLYAILEPAREVGGDLYDFFFVDEQHLCFLVGDVSGKGIPAAFFMAVTKTLVKVIAGQGAEPGKVLARVNNDLAEDNDACMFVTLFLAVLDIRTGELRWASAGHNPPLLISSGGTDFLASPHEPIAGVMENIRYTTSSLVLEYGDVLFLYTDGVTEAMNSRQEMFSDARLLQLVESMDNHQPFRLIGTVREAVAGFAGATGQSDDITMLALQFTGRVM